MASRRKLTTVFIILAGTLALTQAPAAAFPGDLSAGEYNNTTLSGAFGYFNPTDFSSLNVNVNHTTKAFKLVGGAWISTESTTVQIDFFQGRWASAVTAATSSARASSRSTAGWAARL